MSANLRQLFELNLAMLCLATSGVLGSFIPLAPLPAIWWRGGIALVLLGIFCYWKGYDFKLGTARRTGLIVLSGVLMAGHWFTYFYALQTAGVAVGMLAIFTYPAMTTLLEPLLLGSRFAPRHLPLALLVLVGVYCLAPDFDPTNAATRGLLSGLLSALLYSFRNILLKTQVERVHGSVLMFYQMVVTVLLLLPALRWYAPWPSPEAWPYLLLLGFVTTALGHTLFLLKFRFFSVSTVSLLSCVQPVYGIFYAFVFFRDVPAPASLLGGFFILTAVAVESRFATR